MHRILYTWSGVLLTLGCGVFSATPGESLVILALSAMVFLSACGSEKRAHNK
jgi:hypothetical protein